MLHINTTAAGLPGIRLVYFRRGNKLGNKVLDQEWVDLIRQALEAGISKEQIREYLQKRPQEAKAEYKVI